MSEDTLGCHYWELLLAWSGKRPGMLLNLLPCTGGYPHQRIIWPQMSLVPTEQLAANTQVRVGWNILEPRSSTCGLQASSSRGGL